KQDGQSDPQGPTASYDGSYARKDKPVNSLNMVCSSLCAVNTCHQRPSKGRSGSRSTDRGINNIPHRTANTESGNHLRKLRQVADKFSLDLPKLRQSHDQNTGSPLM
ncbi:hypothetical protein BaRGS_00025804, partial [Batillaria attramentaria]